MILVACGQDSMPLAQTDFLALSAATIPSHIHAHDCRADR